MIFKFVKVKHMILKALREGGGGGREQGITATTLSHLSMATQFSPLLVFGELGETRKQTTL